MNTQDFKPFIKSREGIYVLRRVSELKRKRK